MLIFTSPPTTPYLAQVGVLLPLYRIVAMLLYIMARPRHHLGGVTFGAFLAIVGD